MCIHIFRINPVVTYSEVFCHRPTTGVRIKASSAIAESQYSTSQTHIGMLASPRPKPTGIDKCECLASAGKCPNKYALSMNERNYSHRSTVRNVI